MDRSQPQISAFISAATKELVEDFCKTHGIKKAHLIEQALLHHLHALRELPADLIVPPRIVVTERAFEELLDRIEHPRRPTKAMRELFEK